MSPCSMAPGLSPACCTSLCLRIAVRMKPMVQKPPTTGCNARRETIGVRPGLTKGRLAVRRLRARLIPETLPLTRGLASHAVVRVVPLRLDGFHTGLEIPDLNLLVRDNFPNRFEPERHAGNLLPPRTPCKSFIRPCRPHYWVPPPHPPQGVAPCAYHAEGSALRSARPVRRVGGFGPTVRRERCAARSAATQGSMSLGSRNAPDP